MRPPDALYYVMTGQLFDGRKAAEMGLVNWDMSEDYLISKQEQLWFAAGEEREEGFKPALGMYRRRRKE
jgi:feruloyl-CoA hydratase/lyase